MEERLFTTPQTICVGTSKHDTFTIAASRLADPFSLFEPDGERGYLLCLVAGMTGKLCLGGQSVAVSQLVPDSQAGPRWQPLQRSDWGIVALDEAGDIALFFQFIAPSPSGRPHSFFSRLMRWVRR